MARPGSDSSGVGIGGVKRKRKPATLDGDVVDVPVVSRDSHHITFDEINAEEQLRIDAEVGNVTVRPLRLLNVGQKEGWNTCHSKFMKEADVNNFKVVMLQPCPKSLAKRPGKRYVNYMCGETIKELKALGATTADITWNYCHGYMTFPGHESKRNGHVFVADIHSPSLSSSKVQSNASGAARRGAFDMALSSIDEELTDRELNELLGDRIRLSQFAEAHGNRLMALGVVNTETTSAYVDWHIAAEPSHYNQTQPSFLFVVSIWSGVKQWMKR